MAEQTVTQTETLADAQTDWTDTIDFQQFNPNQGSLQAVGVGVTGDVDGSVSIENLGPATVTSDISLLGTVSVTGPDNTSVTADPAVLAGVTLGPYDGTANFAGPSGTVLAGLQNTATNLSNYTISPDPGPFTGTGSVPLTVEARASVTETGPSNLEMLANTSAGAVVTLQYDYDTGASSGSGGGGGSVVTVGEPPHEVFIPDQAVASAIQTFVVPDTITDWAGTIVADQFDPALGTLEAVSLQLIGDLNSSAAIENLGSVESGFSVDQAASITLDLPGTTEVVTPSPNPDSGTLGGFDGSIDFSGASGQTSSGIVSTSTLTDNLTDATDLGAFAGTGTIDLGVAAYGKADATVPGNSLLKLGAFAGATIEISYLYLPTTITSDQYETGFSDFGPDVFPVVGTPTQQTVGVNPVADLAFALPCFARGTRIATEHGERAIESLAVGDRVLLTGGGSASIVWLGRRRVDCRRHPEPKKVWPVRIKAHAFGKGLPRRDLLLSPDHAIYAEDVLIPIKYLTNGKTVMQERLDRIEYWHLELPRHDVVLAEGLAVESLLDSGSKEAFENNGNAVLLYPDFATLRWEAAGCAPLKVVGPEVDRVRARLSQVAPKRSSTKRTMQSRSAVERRRCHVHRTS